MKSGKYKNNYIRAYIGTVFNWAFPETIDNDEETLKNINFILEDEYFDSIMISHIKDLTIRKKIRDMLKSSNIGVSYAAAFPIYYENLNPSSLNENKYLETLKKLKEYIEEAYFFNAKYFLIFSGEDPGIEKRELAKQKLLLTINELCEYSYKLSKDYDYILKITLEPSDRDMAKKYLLGPSIEVCEICKLINVNHDNFGVTIDLSHILLSNEKPLDYLLNLKDYIEDVHINNCIMNKENHTLFGDKHVPFGIEGGEVNTEEIINFLKILRDFNFFYRCNPLIVFEFTPLVKNDVKIVMANFKRVFNESWIKIQEK